MTTEPHIDLMDEVSGKFRLTTITGSKYLVDLDEHTLHREPDLSVEDAVSLRRDSDTVYLLSIRAGLVGASAVFVIDLQVEGVPCTFRITSEVVSIDRLEAGPREDLVDGMADLLHRYPNTLRKLGE
jgi:hypothetical protein